MANRIMLNETSYHGAGAITEIVNEAKARAFRKAFVCSDPDLIEYSCAVKPHIRAGGNRQSGIWETAIASLLA